MALIINVDSDQELREKMEDGRVIKWIRKYFEELKAEEELPFDCGRLCRDNATDYIEVYGHETNMDHRTYKNLEEDFRELVLLAYDQVFGAPEPEAQEPDPDTRTVELPDGNVIVDRYFHTMWERYVENVDSEVRGAVDKPAGKDYRERDVWHEYGRISGVISYLFLSNAFDRDVYTRLSDASWNIYVSAQKRIGEVV